MTGPRGDFETTGFWARIGWFLLAAAVVALFVWGLATIFGYGWERLPWWGR